MTDTTGQDAVVIERTLDAPQGLVWKMWTSDARCPTGPWNCLLRVTSIAAPASRRSLQLVADARPAANRWLTAGRRWLLLDISECPQFSEDTLLER